MCFSHKILVNIYVSMYAYESTTKELQQQNLTFNNQQSFVRWDCSSNLPLMEFRTNRIVPIT